MGEAFRVASIPFTMRRRPSIPQRLFYIFAVPAFALYTVLLHVWAVLIAFRVGETAGAGWGTLALPVASWIWWLDRIPVESVRNGFTLSLRLWFLSAVLMLVAHVANRWLAAGR